MRIKTTHTLIAGSLLLAAAPTYAGITIGGSINAEVASVSGDGYQGDEGIMVTDAMRRDGPYGGNDSWFGAKGSYDVGNGYEAIARVRLKFHPGKWGDNSTKSFNNSETSSQGGGYGDTLFSGRDVFAGVKTPYGDVTVGTMSSPYKSATVKWDPMLGTFMQARGQGGMSKAHNSYMPNTVAYGNTFGRVWVKGAVILDQSDSDDDGEFDAENGMSLGMRVNLSENTTLALGYQDMGDNLDKGDGSTSTKIAVKHKRGKLTLVGQYESTDHYATAYSGAMDFFYVSAGYAFEGDLQVNLGLGLNQDQSDAETAGDGTYASLGIIKNLDKKMRIHAGVINSTSDELDDYTAFGAGVRVGF